MPWPSEQSPHLNAISGRTTSAAETEPSVIPSNCSGVMSFDDRKIGLNNQLASLSYVYCAAKVGNPCAIHAPPLGYVPCGTHMPGRWVGQNCSVPASIAAVSILSLLRLPPLFTSLLMNGANASSRGPCGRAEGAQCATCGPYSMNPYRCLKERLSASSRVHMLYAYGLRYHQKSRRWPDKPHCPMLPLHLSFAVQAYGRSLMAQMGLAARNFVAVQYRTGWGWFAHTQKLNAGWACYGMRSINTTLQKLSRKHVGAGLESMPRFVLTNSRNIHQPSVPVPMQVLSEIYIVSKAHTVLLNPMSSFKDAIVELRTRQAQHNVHFVYQADVVTGDVCQCSAADENEKGSAAAGERQKVCTNSTAADEWRREIKLRETEIKNRKHQRGHLSNTSALRSVRTSAESASMDFLSSFLASTNASQLVRVTNHTQVP